MLDKITFKNYKSFKNRQELELKPLTILIGKNSSGKSAVAKLPTLIENSLSGAFLEPLRVNNNGVELGGEFRDLVYGRVLGGLEIGIKDNNEELNLSIASGTGTADFPRIAAWELKKAGQIIYKTHENSFNGFLDTDSSIQSLSLSTDYIGPFRIRPERSYFGSPPSPIKKIGSEGSHAYSALIQNALTIYIANYFDI